jgi:hypothetical protein
MRDRELIKRVAPKRMRVPPTGNALCADSDTGHGANTSAGGLVRDKADRLDPRRKYLMTFPTCTFYVSNLLDHVDRLATAMLSFHHRLPRKSNSLPRYSHILQLGIVTR